MRGFTLLLTVATVAGAAGCAPAGQPAAPAGQPTTAPAIALAERYFNLAEGYSIRPPARAGRVQQRAASRSVVWSARDRTTGAIAWRLAVRHETHQFQADTLAGIAADLAERVNRTPGHVLESCRVISAAGRQAVDLRLTTGDDGRMWRREVLVHTPRDELLNVVIVGPAADREKLLAMHEKVLASLELLDREALLRQRQANLAAGAKLLASVTAEELAAAVEPQDAWFLITQEGKEIGFMVVRERMTKVYGRDGVEVKAWSMLDVPQGPPQQVAVVMQASADREMESCTWTIGAGEVGSTALSMTKDGNRLQFAGSAITGPREKSSGTYQRVLDESMAASYLPVAMGMMLPRLVDMSEAGSYGFAAYAGYGSELDVSTFTVIGAEEVDCGGSEVRGFRATMRAAEDAEEDLLVLDEAGRLLRKESPGHSVMERSTRREVLERFPPAREMLNQIDAD